MQKLRIAYFGSPDFSAQVLEELLTDPEFSETVTKVFTQKDKPTGRSMQLTKTPVKITAEKHNVLVVDTKPTIKDLEDTDLALLFAYGDMIPTDLLNSPKYGFWNIHPSLLPLFRGPSPVATALINGLTETGVTLMKMDSKLDHGPIIAQKKIRINENESREELTARLSKEGFHLFKHTVEIFTSHDYKIQMQDQVDSKATYTKLLTKKDAFISFENLKLKIENSPEELFNLFRGMSPWPGIWTLLRLKASEGQASEIEKRLKITDMDLIGGKLVIKKVQLEGKKEVSFEQFNSAYKLF